MDNQTAMRLLNLENGFTAKELKTAYRKMAKLYHPDVGGSSHMFKLINDAYELLKSGGGSNSSEKTKPNSSDYYKAGKEHRKREDEKDANHEAYSRGYKGEDEVDEVKGIHPLNVILISLIGVWFVATVATSGNKQHKSYSSKSAKELIKGKRSKKSSHDNSSVYYKGSNGKTLECYEEETGIIHSYPIKHVVKLTESYTMLGGYKTGFKRGVYADYVNKAKTSYWKMMLKDTKDYNGYRYVGTIQDVSGSKTREAHYKYSTHDYSEFNKQSIVMGCKVI